MNAWTKQQLEEDPDGMLEVCDNCNGLIHNWDWLGWSFVTLDGKIVCNDCRGELLKKSIDNL
jgi:hypothetical protein